MSRVISFLVLALIALPLPSFADDKKEAKEKEDEAEKLFLQMEETLLKAKTLDLSFHMTDPEGMVVERSKGTLVAKSGNKAHLEMFGQAVMVSDGTKILWAMPDAKPKDTPKDLDVEVRIWVARTGPMQANIQRVGVPAVPAKERLGVSRFKLGKKEKIGERDTQQIDYQLTVKGEDLPWSVTVWIDLETKLPVKRRITIKKEEPPMSEIYVLKLDEKVDDKKFDLPK